MIGYLSQLDALHTFFKKHLLLHVKRMRSSEFFSSLSLKNIFKEKKRKKEKVKFILHVVPYGFKTINLAVTL